MRSSHNLTRKEPNLKMDAFEQTFLQKVILKRAISTRKDAPRHSSPGECTSNPRGSTTSHSLGWLSSAQAAVTGVGCGEPQTSQAAGGNARGGGTREKPAPSSESGTVPIRHDHPNAGDTLDRAQQARSGKSLCTRTPAAFVVKAPNWKPPNAAAGEWMHGRCCPDRAVLFCRRGSSDTCPDGDGP